MANVVQVVLRGVDQFSSTFGRATRDFAAFRQAAATSAVAVTAAVVALSATVLTLTKQSVDLADETGKAAQKAGVAVEQFSALAYAGGQAELSMDDLVKASKAWSKQAEDGKSITGLFTDDLIALADEFKNTADGSAKVTRAMELFGKAGQSMIPFLNQGSAALREQFEEAEKFGLIIGRDFARNADQFNDNLSRMGSLFRGVWNQVAERTLPTLLSLSEGFLRFASNSSVVENSVALLSKSVLTLAEVFLKGMEAYITFSGLLNGQSFGQIGAELLALQTNIEELRAQFAQPLPEPTVAGPTIEEKQRRVQELIDSQARAWLTTNNSYFEATYRAHDEYVAAVEKINSDEMLSEQNKNFFIAGERELLKKKMLKIEQDEARERQRIQQGILGATGNLFGNLAALAATHGKKGFALAQAFRYAEAIVSTAAGVARALAEYPWPYSIVVGALVAAAGAVQLATIASAKPPSAHAGLGYVPQDATYVLRQGERVLAPRQNLDLTQFLEGGGPGTGGSGRMVEVVLELDGKTLGAALYDMSRSGRLRVDSRSVT